MLESSRLWLAPLLAFVGLTLAACTVAQPQPLPAPAEPVAAAPVAAPRDEAALTEEAKAMLAQAETDVQRARARHALWLKAWEDLLSARRAVATGDSSGAIRYAKQASDLAQLGLEQLAYPAVK